MKKIAIIITISCFFFVSCGKHESEDIFDTNILLELSESKKSKPKHRAKNIQKIEEQNTENIQNLDDQDPETLMSNAIARFTLNQRKNLNALALELGLKVSENVEAFFDAVEAGDWNAISNMYISLDLMSGRRYVSSNFNGKMDIDETLNSPLWPIIFETYYGLKMTREWGPELSSKLTKSFFENINDNSVALNASAAMRLICNIFQNNSSENNISLINYYALCDKTYLDYASFNERQNQSSVELPDNIEFEKVFADYVKKLNKQKVNGKITISDVKGVMELNGNLVKTIWKKNPAKNFYIEENYVLPWMNDYLEPSGMIMKLGHEKTELTSEIINKNNNYWNNLIDSLNQSGEIFTKNEEAKRTFANSRAAIARFYEARGYLYDAESAFLQAIELCPSELKSTKNLSNVYLKQNRIDDALKIAMEFKKKNPDNKKADILINKIKKN